MTCKPEWVATRVEYVDEARGVRLVVEREATLRWRWTAYKHGRCVNWAMALSKSAAMRAAHAAVREEQPS